MPPAILNINPRIHNTSRIPAIVQSMPFLPSCRFYNINTLNVKRKNIAALFIAVTMLGFARDPYFYSGSILLCRTSSGLSFNKVECPFNHELAVKNVQDTHSAKAK